MLIAGGVLLVNMRPKAAPTPTASAAQDGEAGKAGAVQLAGAGADGKGGAAQEAGGPLERAEAGNAGEKERLLAGRGSDPMLQPDVPGGGRARPGQGQGQGQGEEPWEESEDEEGGEGPGSGVPPAARSGHGRAQPVQGQGQGAGAKKGPPAALGRLLGHLDSRIVVHHGATQGLSFMGWRSMERMRAEAGVGVGETARLLGEGQAGSDAQDGPSQSMLREGKGLGRCRTWAGPGEGEREGHRQADGTGVSIPGHGALKQAAGEGRDGQAAQDHEQGLLQGSSSSSGGHHKL